jgi:molybdopterin converting factor subunit 1
MRLTVLLFASYADAMGGPTVMVDIPPNGTVADLVAKLRELAGGSRLPPSPLVAVNHSYARHDHRLSESDEVAVIPPVAGG